MTKLSPRLAEIIEALPIDPSMRILDIGGGPGAAARAVATRLERGSILMIDRSAIAIRQARTACADEIASGRMDVRQSAIEDFELGEDERPFDIAFGVRIGALDGRHPAVGRRALSRITAVLKQGGRLFIDGGDPLREIELPRG